MAVHGADMNSANKVGIVTSSLARYSSLSLFLKMSGGGGCVCKVLYTFGSSAAGERKFAQVAVRLFFSAVSIHDGDGAHNYSSSHTNKTQVSPMQTPASPEPPKRVPRDRPIVNENENKVSPKNAAPTDAADGSILKRKSIGLSANTITKAGTEKRVPLKERSDVMNKTPSSSPVPSVPSLVSGASKTKIPRRLSDPKKFQQTNFVSFIADDKPKSTQTPPKATHTPSLMLKVSGHSPVPSSTKTKLTKELHSKPSDVCVIVDLDQTAQSRFSVLLLLPSLVFMAILYIFDPAPFTHLHLTSRHSTTNDNSSMSSHSHVFSPCYETSSMPSAADEYVANMLALLKDSSSQIDEEEPIDIVATEMVTKSEDIQLESLMLDLAYGSFEDGFSYEDEVVYSSSDAGTMRAVESFVASLTASMEDTTLTTDDGEEFTPEDMVRVIVSYLDYMTHSVVSPWYSAPEEEDETLALIRSFVATLGTELHHVDGIVPMELMLQSFVDFIATGSDDTMFMDVEETTKMDETTMATIHTFITDFQSSLSVSTFTTADGDAIDSSDFASILVAYLAFIRAAPLSPSYAAEDDESAHLVASFAAQLSTKDLHYSGGSVAISAMLDAFIAFVVEREDAYPANAIVNDAMQSASYSFSLETMQALHDTACDYILDTGVSVLSTISELAVTLLNSDVFEQPFFNTLGKRVLMLLSLAVVSALLYLFLGRVASVVAAPAVVSTSPRPNAVLNKIFKETTKPIIQSPLPSKVLSKIMMPSSIEKDVADAVIADILSSPMAKKLKDNGVNASESAVKRVISRVSRPTAASAIRTRSSARRLVA